MVSRILLSMMGLLGVALGLSACALKAHVVGPPPRPVSERTVEKAAGQQPLAAAPLPPGQTQPDDGIRLPSNLLSLPQDKDLKATNPAATKAGENGAVISKPPVEKKE